MYLPGELGPGFTFFGFCLSFLNFLGVGFCMISPISESVLKFRELLPDFFVFESSLLFRLFLFFFSFFSVFSFFSLLES